MLDETKVVGDASVRTGLSEAQVIEARAKYGLNKVEEKRTSIWWKLLSQFVGIAAFILEATIIATLALQDWIEAGVVAGLLIFNAIVGFEQTMQAEKALIKLQQALTINARVLRDSVWKSVSASELVPGDVIRLRQGDMVPADMNLLEGNVDIDESSLTGESTAVSRSVGSQIFAGSLVQVGEALGVVTATGHRTKFDQTVRLVSLSAPKLHMNVVVNRIVFAEMVIAFVFVIACILILVTDPQTRSTFVSQIPLFLLLVVLAAPVTLPPMLTLTSALGSLFLSRNNVLVTRLSATEDASEMTVLCTDKTGTVTQNRLSVVQCSPLSSFTDDFLLECAGCASKKENLTPIDSAVLDAVAAQRKLGHSSLFKIDALNFVPFNPTTRRTSAEVRISTVHYIQTENVTPIQLISNNE